MESDKKEFAVEKFRGSSDEDFHLWATRLMAVLESKDLSDVVRQKDAAAAGISDNDYTKKALKARAYIVVALGDLPLRSVLAEDTPYKIWLKPHARYASLLASSRIIVLTTIMNKKLEADTIMRERVSELESLFHRRLAMKSPLEEEIQVAILLVSLSERENFRGTVSAIKTMDPKLAT